MLRAHSRRPLVLAIALSVVLHVFLFRGLREASPPKVPPASSRVEVEIREVLRPPAVVAQAPMPAPARRRPKRIPSPSPVPAPREAETPDASAVDPAPGPVASGVPSGGRALASDFPVRHEALLPRIPPSASTWGILPDPLASAPGKDPGTGATGAPGPRRRAPEPMSPSDAVHGLVAEQRVRSGFVHAYFAQLQDVLLAAWRASGTSSRRKSGRTCEVEVRLVQAPSGRLLEASIRTPSCDSSMDEEVLSDLRAAAESLPAPPPEVVGQRDSIRSVYRFTFQPAPTIPPLEFDVVDLFDRKAIPAFNPKRVTLVSAQ